MQSKDDTRLSKREAGRLGTRAKIFAGALAEFSDHGFHATSIPKLAKTAGIGVGTLYSHFSDKQDLGQALFLHWKRRYVVEVFESLPRDGNWRATFSELWRRWMVFSSSNPGVLEFIEYQRHEAYLDRTSQELRELEARASVMLDIMRQAQADGAVVDGPPYILTNMVFGAFLRLVRAERAGLMQLSEADWKCAEDRAWAIISAKTEVY